MKNIREIARELIAEKGPITSKDIKKLIKHDSLLNIDDAALEARIYNDLLTDGNFIFINKTWDDKDKYTMNEIVREQYRSIGNVIEEEDDETFEEEPIMKVVLDTEEGDDVISINDIADLDVK